MQFKSPGRRCSIRSPQYSSPRDRGSAKQSKSAKWGRAFRGIELIGTIMLTKDAVLLAAAAVPYPSVLLRAPDERME